MTKCLCGLRKSLMKPWCALPCVTFGLVGLLVFSLRTVDLISLTVQWCVINTEIRRYWEVCTLGLKRLWITPHNGAAGVPFQNYSSKISPALTSTLLIMPDSGYTSVWKGDGFLKGFYLRKGNINSLLALLHISQEVHAKKKKQKKNITDPEWRAEPQMTAIWEAIFFCTLVVSL